jgi:calcineurin-like phosphoesterase family protein
MTEFNIDSFDFIISDTHFNHNNIVDYCQRIGHDPRGHATDYDRHNQLMIEQWQRYVKPDSIILHLGDVAMGQKHLLPDIMKVLPGRKFLVKGNHDKWSTELYESLGFEVIQPFMFEHMGWNIFFSHYPKRVLQRLEANVHGHIHNNAVDGLTRKHKNVSVEVMSYTPQNFRSVVEGVVWSSNADSSNNFNDSEWNTAPERINKSRKSR